MISLNQIIFFLDDVFSVGHGNLVRTSVYEVSGSPCATRCINIELQPLMVVPKVVACIVSILTILDTTCAFHIPLKIFEGWLRFGR